MELREIGESGLKLSALGLGCWQFSKNTGYGGKFWPKLTNDNTTQIVQKALEHKVNWFDTAELYGWGKSEESLSLSLQKLKINSSSNFIATKWWPLFRNAQSIKNTIDKRLYFLKGYPITLHQVHMPYGFSSIEKEMNMMADLVEEGKIKHVGVSNFNKKQMLRAYDALEKRGIHLTSNQMEYSILNRRIESNGVLEYAKKLNISIIAYSPLAQGIVSGKFHDNSDLLKNMHKIRKRKIYQRIHRGNGLKSSKPVIDMLKKIANKHQSTPSQIALSWLINYHGNTVFAIPGATNVKQIEDNMSAVNIKLSESELNHLNILSEKFK